MAATYTPVPRTVPSAQRVVEITDVVDGDQIDLTDALGRPAKKVQFHMVDAADTVEYTLNNLKKILPQRTAAESYNAVDRNEGVFGKTQVEIWSGAAGFPSFSSTGSTVLETGDGLEVSSIQIDALTFTTGGTAITIIAW